MEKDSMKAVLIAIAIVDAACAQAAWPCYANLMYVLESKSSHQAKSSDNSFSWFDSNFLKRLSITGRREIGFHAVSVTGDTTAYNTLTNFGQGNQTFTDIGQMSIVGNQVLGLFNFNFQFADNRYQDPLSSRFSLDYDRKGTQFDAGDINGSLHSENEFLNFNRQLWGVSAGTRVGRMGFNVLHSTAKSSAQTFSFTGTNSPGPYYLQSSKIIPDSVRVLVDGVELKYPDDFVVDSIVGAVTFTKRSISPTSTIVVSYESLGINSGGGQLDGFNGSYDFGAIGKLGFTAARQTDPTSGGLSTFDDRFQGYGDASIPYFLQYQPLASFPVIVRVDGIIQALNIDYYFSPTNPVVFYFRRPISTSSTVDVLYTPQPTGTTGGDRSDYGFDYRLGFGRKERDGNLTYSQAWSHLANPVTPLSGLARGVAAVYKLKNYKFTANLDDIPNSFTGVESTGFTRNEKSTSFGVSYLFKKLRYGIDTTNSLIGLRDVASNGGYTFSSTRTTQTNANLSLQTTDKAAWSLQQSHQTTVAPTGNSKADITSMSYSKPFGKLNLRLGLDRTSGYGPIVDSTGTSNGSIVSNALSLRADYVPANGLILGARTSLSDIRTGSQSGKGTDVSLNAQYTAPKRQFTFTTSYTLSNSGDLASLGGFANGSGLGYNGNGFSNGYTGGSASSFNAGGSNVKQWSASSNYAINKRANLSLNFVTYDQSGSVTTNSNTTTYGLATDYDLHGGQHFSLALSQSATSFVGSTSFSNSTSLDFNFTSHQPKSPWTYDASVSSLLSSGGTFAQNSLRWQFDMRHRIHSNQAAFLDYNFGNVTQYQPQTNSGFDLGYEYQLFKNVSVIGKYRFNNITNLDPTVTTGAYGAKGFDVELNFNFGY